MTFIMRRMIYMFMYKKTNKTGSITQSVTFMTILILTINTKLRFYDG